MQKEAAWLLAELDGLVQKGVLEPGAAARLRDHYAAAAGGPRLSWGLVLLAIGGAALVGLGVILIFAHNWDSWTPGLRAVLSVLPLLLGQAACAWALRGPSRLWREGAGLFTAIAVGASVALVAQTYQFGGDLPQFLLTWMLLAVPLAYLLDASAVAVGCWALLLGWVFAQEPAWIEQAGAWPDALRVPAFLVLFALPLPHLLHHVRIDRGAARVAWMLRVAIVVFVLGLGVTAIGIHDDALFIVYASVAAAAVLAGQRWFGDVHGLWGNPLRTAGHLGVFLVVLCATFDVTLDYFEWPQSSLMLLPLLFGTAAAWLAWQAFAAGDRLLAPLFGALTPFVYLLPALHGSAAAAVLAHLYALALAAAYVLTGLRTADLALANLGASLAAGLLLVRFFDSDLSYVVRGVGFIVTGLAFFAALFWLRRRLREAP